jgi:hypothetical protein
MRQRRQRVLVVGVGFLDAAAAARCGGGGSFGGGCDGGGVRVCGGGS